MCAASPSADSARRAATSAVSAAATRGAARARRGEHDRADALGEPERLEPAHELGAGELAAHDRGEHVAREPPFGVLGDAAAQQLQRDDRDGLVEREAVELGEAALVLRREQPRLQRRDAAVRAGGRAGDAARRDRERQRAARELGQRRGEALALALAGALAQLARQLGERLLAELVAEGPLHEQPAARVEDEHAAADHRRQRTDERVEAALGEDDPLEPLVRGERAAQHRVLLVDEPAEGALGDGDERRLVRHLEQRQVALGGGGDERLRDRVVAEAGAEAEPGELVVGEPRDERALALGGVELEPGREQQLAAGHPRRRVLQLRDVDPAHGRVEARLPGERPHVQIAQKLADAQHRSRPRSMARSRRRACGASPPRARAAARPRSPRTAPSSRSAAARAG